MRGVACGLVLALLGTFSSASAAGAKNWSWKSLHRRLHVPRIPSGAVCPVSPLSTVDLGNEGTSRFRGSGPAYPALGGRDATLEFFWPPLKSQTDFYGTGWSGNKVLWWVAGYRGPVLIRGRQVDGSHQLRFDRGRPPQREIRIRPLPGWKGPRDRASYTRLQAPGCYAYQIDGTSFSRVIVFEAQIVAPPQ